MCQIRPKTERRRGDVLGRRSICRDADRLSVVFNSKSLGFRSERRRDKPDQTGSQSLPHRNPTGNHSTLLRQNRPETERRRDELGRKLLDVVIDPTKSLDIVTKPTESQSTSMEIRPKTGKSVTRHRDEPNRRSVSGPRRVCRRRAAARRAAADATASSRRSARARSRRQRAAGAR